MPATDDPDGVAQALTGDSPADTRGQGLSAVADPFFKGAVPGFPGMHR